jgi:molecular chaperone GrpE
VNKDAQVPDLALPLVELVTSLEFPLPVQPAPPIDLAPSAHDLVPHWEVGPTFSAPVEEPAEEPAKQGDPRIESALDDFRSWLAQTLPPPDSAAHEPEEPEPVIDLQTLVGHFVALRQEVNLQTKAVRNQQELNTGTLQTLQQAVTGLERARAEARQDGPGATEERLRPLLKALIELHDALALAGREITRLQDHLGPDLEELSGFDAGMDLLSELPPLEEVEEDLEEPGPIARPAPAPSPTPSLWSRFFGGHSVETPPPVKMSGTAQEASRQRAEARRRAREARREAELAARERLRQRLEERTRQVREQGERVRQALAGVVTGYTMSLQRVERAVRQQGLEPIATVGQPFDPERMEALEPVAGTGRPSGEVVEEIRRGYLWNGRVFRFALVRVARG